MSRCQDTVPMTERHRGKDVANGSSWGTRSRPRCIFSGLTPATGALLERTNISLGTRGNKMQENNKKNQTEEKREDSRTRTWDHLEKLLTSQRPLLPRGSIFVIIDAPVTAARQKTLFIFVRLILLCINILCLINIIPDCKFHDDFRSGISFTIGIVLFKIRFFM